MASFLTALASMGSQYGQAKIDAASENAKLQQQAQEAKMRAAQLGMEQTNQQLAQQRLDLEKQQAARQPDFYPVDLGKGRKFLWSYSKGRFLRDDELPKTATDDASTAGMAYRKILDTSNLTPQQKQEADLAVQMELDASGDPAKAYKAGWDFVRGEGDKNTAAQEKKDAAALTEKNRREDKALQMRQSLQDKLEFLRMSLMMRPTAAEWQRADLAKNVDENLNAIEDIVLRRPDLFGKFWGRVTQGREWIGTSDTDIAALKQAEDNLGRALTGAHGMRAASTLEAAGNGVLNSFKNSPDATLNAIATARQSVGTFIADVQDKVNYGGGGGPAPTPTPQNSPTITPASPDDPAVKEYLKSKGIN